MYLCAAFGCSSPDRIVSIVQEYAERQAAISCITVRLVKTQKLSQSRPQFIPTPISTSEQRRTAHKEKNHLIHVSKGL